MVPPPRALWRTAAAAVAGAASTPGPSACPEEAALFGVLGGDVEAALTLAAGWHDCLWVVARCALEAKIDTLLGADPPPSSPPCSLPDILAAAAAAAASRPAPAPVPAADAVATAATSAAHRAAQEAIISGGPSLDAFVTTDLRRWATPGGAGAPPGGGRFAAHAALALADVILLPDPADPHPPTARIPVTDATNAAIALHCVSLVDAGAGALVPPLAARAARYARSAIVALRLRSLRDAPASDAAEALDSMAAWLDGWAAAGRGDVEVGETAAAAAAAATRARAAAAGRPTARAAAARWLWLAPATLSAAAAASVRLLRELAVNGGPAAAAATERLLSEIPDEARSALAAPPADLLAAGLDADTVACLVEVAAWARVAAVDAAWRGWLSDYRSLEASSRAPRRPPSARRPRHATHRRGRPGGRAAKVGE